MENFVYIYQELMDGDKSLSQYSPSMLKDLYGLIVAALCILLLGAVWVSWQRMYEVVLMYRRRVWWFTIGARVVWAYFPSSVNYCF